MLAVCLFGLFITSVAGYSMCPMHVECIPGCVGLDERGCKTCACGPAMFVFGAGRYGMPSMGGGGSFHPGSLGGGNSFGSIMGAGGGYHAVSKPKEKPLKECKGTMLCMMTCTGHYSLSDQIGSDGCRACTCPKEEHHVTVVVPVKEQTKPPTHPDCTGTKLCLLTCKGKAILGEHGKDGCQTCACVPETKVIPLVEHKEPECHVTALCMSSCKHGYSLGAHSSSGCRECDCKPAPTPAPTPAPHRLECPDTLRCMLSCSNGYQLGSAGPDGCPHCSCLKEPDTVLVIKEVTCSQALSCRSGCTVGYKCDSNGCPTCECVRPEVVGVLTVTEVHTKKELSCNTALSCSKSCSGSVGYKCGEDGCPICECLIKVQTAGSGGTGITSSGSGSFSPFNHGNGGMGPNGGISPGTGHMPSSSGASGHFSSGGTGAGPFTPTNGGSASGSPGGSASGSGSLSPFNPGSSGSGPFHPSGSSGPFTPSGSNGQGSGTGPFTPTNGNSVNGGSFPGSGNYSPYGPGSSGSGPFSPSGSSGPFTPSGSNGQGSGVGPFTPTNGNSINGGSSSGTGKSSPFGQGIGSGGPMPNTGISGGNTQGFGPTVDSCGPFGCLPAVNNTNTGAGGLGGALTQTNGGGIGAGTQTHNGAGGAGMSPFSGHGSGSGSVGSGGNNAGMNGGPGGSGPFASGPFASAGTGSNGPFSMDNSTWQSGSANGKGWVTGGIGGPFSNGQGSGTSAGAFHTTGGQGSGGTGSPNFGGPGSNGGTNNGTGSRPYSTAPGTGSGGPFTMTTGTGDGLPFSPFSAAAGHNSGNGVSSGPFAQASAGNSGPFAQASGAGAGFAKGPTTGNGQAPFGAQTGVNTLTDGSGGILEPSVGSYSSPQHGSTFSWGSNGGQSPFLAQGHQPSGTGAFGPQSLSSGGRPSGSSSTSTNILTKLRDCPETLNCMKICVNGYNLQGSFDEGCPTCTCAGGSSTGAIAGTLIQENSRIAPVPRNCPTKFSCPSACHNGYSSGTDGCPTCSCVGQQGSPQKSDSVECEGTFTCPASCRHGYSCGQDGCPTCDCVQVTNVKPIIVEPKPQTTAVSTLVSKCHTTMSCMTSCDKGYTLGTEGKDGCPACSCIQPATTECHTGCEHKPAMTFHSCDKTVQCMASCTDGYELGATGSDGCPSCTCKQPECHTGCTETHQQVIEVVQTTSGGSGGSSGGALTTSGGSSGGGRGPFSAGGSGGGMTGGGDMCPPLPPNCHPYCIKYDVAHCRKCECASVDGRRTPGALGYDNSSRGPSGQAQGLGHTVGEIWTS